MQKTLSVLRRKVINHFTLVNAMSAQIHNDLMGPPEELDAIADHYHFEHKTALEDFQLYMEALMDCHK